MNQDRFNNCQEAFDNQDGYYDEQWQTLEEIEAEEEQEFRYNKLIEDASNMEWNATASFIHYIDQLYRGEIQDGADLLMFMISQAADYNGSEATVPDFVRLVRLAFEWKSKK